VSAVALFAKAKRENIPALTQTTVLPIFIYHLLVRLDGQHLEMLQVNSGDSSSLEKAPIFQPVQLGSKEGVAIILINRGLLKFGPRIRQE
jgi:hypothetical protein